MAIKSNHISLIKARQLSAGVDEYIERHLIDNTDLEDVSLYNKKSNLPEIAVSPLQGKFLNLLAASTGAKHILEIGTLGAYSTIWLAKALPTDGQVITLESNKEYAQIAEKNIKQLGLENKVQVILKDAKESLADLIKAKKEFDFIFIDADKQNQARYLELCIEVSKSGTLIIGDNVVRAGEIINPDNKEASVQGVKEFYKLIKEHPRLDATAIQTVGTKGYDGFALVRVI